VKAPCPDVADCVRGLATGAFSAAELAGRILSRLEAAPHAYISFDQAAFRQAAAHSDARRRSGQILGPLDGVPIAIKDNIDVAGQPTTAGARLRKDAPPARADAAIVARLRAAGMLVAGKTNLSEFAYSGLGYNPHFGTPHLLGQADCLPGGSSSGSAIAVAAGLAAAALGTDTAGSARIPAAFTGILGYRASQARYGMDGVFPLASSFDTLGFLARSVADIALLDFTLIGEPAGKPAPGLVYDPSALERLTLAPEVARDFLGFLSRLSTAGFQVEARPLAFLGQTLDQLANGWPGAFEAFEHLGALATGPRHRELDPRVRARLLAAGDLDRPWYEAMMAARRPLQSAARKELAGRLLVLPTVSHLAPKLSPLLESDEAFAAANLSALRLTMIGSYLDLAALALPASRAEARPGTSVSLLAPGGQDARLLATGCEIERRIELPSI
jgi:aspartyl-tRNA(Asn)/glutamyl-tRNA(Gln) amidotransferase subunit A